jgi:hypothetical protein
MEMKARLISSVQNVGIAIAVLQGDTLAAKSITYVNDLQTRNFFLATANVAQSGEPATFGLRFSYKY